MVAAGAVIVVVTFELVEAYKSGWHVASAAP
jgi:hypothetical protein